MIPKLQQSDRFITDYKNYQQQISEVTDPTLQKELVDALLKLKEHVQFLDRSHEQVFMTGKMPSEVTDLRSDVSRYKQILDRKLADWKHRQLNNH
jgi:glutaredoxin 2